LLMHWGFFFTAYDNGALSALKLTESKCPERTNTETVET